LNTAIQAWQATDAKTHLYDAIYEAASRARTAPTSLVAILVLTDGRDEESALKLDDAITNATTANVPVYAVGVGSHIDALALRRLARLTGGKFLAAAEAEQISDLYQTVWSQVQS